MDTLFHTIALYGSIILGVICLAMTLVFAIGKGRVAHLVSGFNTIPKSEQAKYDLDAIAKDMRNSFLLYTVIMITGLLGTIFFTPYSAFVAWIAFGFLYFRNFSIDPADAYHRYLLHR